MSVGKDQISIARSTRKKLRTDLLVRGQGRSLRKKLGTGFQFTGKAGAYVRNCTGLLIHEEGTKESNVHPTTSKIPVGEAVQLIGKRFSGELAVKSGRHDCVAQQVGGFESLEVVDSSLG